MFVVDVAVVVVVVTVVDSSGGIGDGGSCVIGVGNSGGGALPVL
jgi:hypothetical protein